MSLEFQIDVDVPGHGKQKLYFKPERFPISIGRGSANAICVPLVAVSRKHALIFKENGEWGLKDLNSKHGTLLNGKPIGKGGKKLLQDGDLIGVLEASLLVQFPIKASLYRDFPEEQTSMIARQMMQGSFEQNQLKEGPYLLIMNGMLEGSRFEIGGLKEFWIGRDVQCQLSIEDPSVSRKHALIRLNWDEIWIEDVGSTNGVLVSGERVKEPKRLKDGDEISIGSVQLTFVDPGSRILGELSKLAVFQEEEKKQPAKSKEQELENISQEAPVKGRPIQSEMPTKPISSPQKSIRTFGGMELMLVVIGLLVLLGLVLAVFAMLYF